MSAQGIAATSADDADVVVIGDGPAGSALALACQRIGVSVVLVGDDAPWNATYSTWSDELDAPAAEGLLCIADVTATSSDEVWAYGASAHRLRRAYVTLDNNRLRTALRDGVPHRGARVTQVVTAPSGSTARHRLELSDGRSISARVVVDATGWPAVFARGGGVRHAPAWQTAIGVVLATPPAGELGRATFMDFRHVPDAAGRRSADDAGDATTFCYSLPTTDGWLVEETVLAARPAVDPISLLPRLAARLGCGAEDLLGEAIRTEYVRIPLGGSRPDLDQPVVAFGAAAGYVHAATGFSVAASLRAAPRVAASIAATLSEGPGAVDTRPIAEAVWPTAMRRTRVLHDYGLDVLLGLNDDEVRSFFDAFFELPLAQWSSYLMVDTAPRRISASMAALFRSSGWPMRRRLAEQNPLKLARLLRP